MEKILTVLLLIFSLSCWTQEKAVIHILVLDQETQAPIYKAEVGMVTKDGGSQTSSTDIFGKTAFELEKVDEVIFGIRAHGEDHYLAYRISDTISAGQEKSFKIYLKKAGVVDCFPTTIYYKNNETTVLKDKYGEYTNFIIVEFMKQSLNCKIEIFTYFNFDEDETLAQKRQQEFLAYAQSEGIDTSRFIFEEKPQRKIRNVEVQGVEIELNKKLFETADPGILKLYAKMYQVISFGIIWD